MLKPMNLYFSNVELSCDDKHPSLFQQLCSYFQEANVKGVENTQGVLLMKVGYVSFALISPSSEVPEKKKRNHAYRKSAKK